TGFFFAGTIMTKEQLTRLRSYYHSLRGQQKVLESIDSPFVDGLTLGQLTDELGRIENDFAGLLPPLSIQEHFSHKGLKRRLYNLSGIRSFLARAIARLEALLAESEGEPVTQTREFAFMKDLALRAIIERDYLEIQKAYIAGCWKSVVILAGSAIEAILLDRLQQDPGKALAVTGAPTKPDLSRWDLADLIDVAVKLKIVSPAVEQL